jgi:hypothetical protein
MGRILLIVLILLCAFTTFFLYRLVTIGNGSALDSVALWLFIVVDIILVHTLYTEHKAYKEQQ